MTKTFVRIFTIADYEEEETWLREQHKAGWKLVKLTPPCWYTFEKVQPEDVIYRLDFKNEALTEEYTNMFADFGWEYAGKCVGWYYFRKPAAEAETEEDTEIFSDNESKADQVRHLVRIRMLPLICIFLCCVVPNFSHYADGTARGPLSVFALVFFTVMFVIYIWLLLHCSFKLRKLKEKYTC